MWRSDEPRFSVRGFGCAFFLWEVRKMSEELYFKLFNKITDMIEELKMLQCEMEEMYISNDTK